VSSWFAHKDPFEFNIDFESARGIDKYAVGTPPVISMAAIEPGLDLILEAGIDNLRRKSLVQSRFLIDLIRAYLVPLGFKLASPADDESRGSHVSLRHKDAYRINRALIEPGNDSIAVIPDFRPPDNIRLGIAPLYNSFMDLFYTVERIKEIIETGEFKEFDKERLRVT
jgi:kynureninase